MWQSLRNTDKKSHSFQPPNKQHSSLHPPIHLVLIHNARLILVWRVNLMSSRIMIYVLLWSSILGSPKMSLNLYYSWDSFIILSRTNKSQKTKHKEISQLRDICILSSVASILLMCRTSMLKTHGIPQDSP